MDPSIEDVVVRSHRSRLPRAVENGDGDTITTKRDQAGGGTAIVPKDPRCQ
jgi:hypothetical protein